MFAVSAGSEYTPSDGPTGPAALKRKKKERLREEVNASRIDRNETNPIQKAAITADETTYRTRMANLTELQEILQTLDVLKDREWLSEKFICNFIFSHWWDLRFSPGNRPIYLPCFDMHLLSLEIQAKGFVLYEGLERAPFFDLYQSTAWRKEDRVVCFLLLRNQGAMANGEMDCCQRSNHFFPVLFNYDDHMAHVFGTTSVMEPEVRAQIGNESGWQYWLGPQLWKSIGQGMGWGEHVGDPNAVEVVTKNWHQVCGSSNHSRELARKLNNLLERIRLWNVLTGDPPENGHAGQIEYPRRWHQPSLIQGVYAREKSSAAGLDNGMDEFGGGVA